MFPEIDHRTLTKRLKELGKQIAGGRGDRNDIATALCRDIGIDKTMLERICTARLKEFDRFVQLGILEVGISDQKVAILRILSKTYSLFLNSATPLDPLTISLDALGILDVFTKVYGRPGTKLGNLQSIVVESGASPSEIICIDDQPKAAKIANEVGCQFVGIRTKNVSFSEESAFPIVANLEEFAALLA